MQTDKRTYMISDVISAFILDRRSKRLSPHTIAFYTQELNLFTSALPVYSLTDLSANHIRQYLIDLSSRRNGGGCHASYRAIRAFFLWAWVEYDLPERNPINRVDPPKRNTDILPGVSLPDVAAMIAVCAGRFALRDRAILYCLLDTGMRAFELCACNVVDFNSVAGTIVVRHGKGDKQRMVYLEQTARRSVRAYLRTRPIAQDTDSLFSTQSGSRFSVNGLRGIVQRRAADAGITSPGLHDFRRAFATTLHQAGADVIRLQELMGHQDLSTTRRYISVGEDSLRASHAVGSPVERMIKK